MIYNINYSDSAEKEAEEIGEYYEKIAPGLSLRFFNDLNHTIITIQRNPSAFHYYKKDKNIRRANLDIFSFCTFLPYSYQRASYFCFGDHTPEEIKIIYSKKNNPVNKYAHPGNCFRR